MQLGGRAGSPPVHPIASAAPESVQELLIHLLSLNFSPGAGSCAGGLSAVKQRVKHAATELALRVSAAWHCLPMNVGNVNILKETNAGFAKLEVINSVFKKPQPVKILPPG